MNGIVTYVGHMLFVCYVWRNSNKVNVHSIFSIFCFQIAYANVKILHVNNHLTNTSFVLNNFFVICCRTIQDPASQRLTWYKPPLTVLVIKKVRDVSVLSPFVELVHWLIEVSFILVYLAIFI